MGATADVIAPRALTLPVIDTGTAGQTGSIGMSGADLYFYDGSNWVQVAEV